MDGGCSLLLGWILFAPALLLWAVIGRIVRVRKRLYIAGIALPATCLILWVVNWLWDAKFDEDVQVPFREAVLAGDVASVRSLLEKGADPNDADIGIPMVYHAAEDGHTEIVRLLIARGSDVNWREPCTGNTALSLARRNKHTEIVKMLKKAGAKR